MSLDLDENKSMYQIRSYEPGRIKINEQIFTHSIVITPNQLITDWPPQSVQTLSEENLTYLISLKPSIVLIGTGPSHVLLPVHLYGKLINAGIGVEVMSTIAASRTFNALSAENRNVAAALIIA